MVCPIGPGLSVMTRTCGPHATLGLRCWDHSSGLPGVERSHSCMHQPCVQPVVELDLSLVCTHFQKFFTREG